MDTKIHKVLLRGCYAEKVTTTAMHVVHYLQRYLLHRAKQKKWHFSLE